MYAILGLLKIKRLDGAVDYHRADALELIGIIEMRYGVAIEVATAFEEGPLLFHEERRAFIVKLTFPNANIY